MSQLRCSRGMAGYCGWRWNGGGVFLHCVEVRRGVPVVRYSEIGARVTGEMVMMCLWMVKGDVSAACVGEYVGAVRELREL